MKVILTDSRSDLGGRSVSAHSDCACDCQCACPTDRVSVGEPIPTLALPVAYYLELTPVCNNHCPGCGNGETFCKEPALCEHQPAKAAIPSSTRGQWLRDSGLMPLDGAEWCDLVERLASHARQFKLTGGEPTLHPDLATIVRQIDCLGVPFTLFTNGRWMDPAALLHLLRDADRFDGFLISLHGPDAATHEAFNGVPGSFAETVANIRRAAQAGFDVAVSMVIDRTNWDCVTETLDFVLCLGANHLVCNRLIGSASSVMPSEAQLRAAMAEVGRGCAQGQPVRFGNCIPQCFEPSFSRGCTAGTTFATIDPWGRMRPCNHSPLIAGDVRTQSVETVWHGEA
ncbi:MAG: radical SAM protein, partial [Anaerolineae bacterium]|nr:radical SAM protein [Anaerolineae bacterium]